MRRSLCASASKILTSKLSPAGRLSRSKKTSYPAVSSAMWILSAMGLSAEEYDRNTLILATVEYPSGQIRGNPVDATTLNGVSNSHHSQSGDFGMINRPNH